MHIPSERIYREMRSADATLRIATANEGRELALLIKAPSSAIKALIAGCQLQLLFGREGPYLNSGARILDMPDAPMLILGPLREQEEHHALARFIADRSSKVFLFNEMDVCLAWTTLEIAAADAARVAEICESPTALYVGPFTPECSQALDCFCFSVDPTNPQPGATLIPVVTMQVTLEHWRISSVTFIGLSDHQTIALGDQNEGEMFERAVWASLESVFPLTLYKGAQVKIGDKTRELTDVLAFHEYGSFLIEAKDLSILQAGYNRDQERRTRGVQKQAKKAISQLVGACKAIERGDRVFDATGKELAIVREQPAHCIVLITDLMQWGDWSEVEAQLVEAMRSTGAFFHLLDLREFTTLLKGSAGKASLFDYNLMERCKVFAGKRSVHIRSQLPVDSSSSSTVAGNPITSGTVKS